MNTTAPQMNDPTTILTNHPQTLLSFLINYHIVIFNGHLFKEEKKTVCAVLHVFSLTLQQSVNLMQCSSTQKPVQLSWRTVGA